MADPFHAFANANPGFTPPLAAPQPGAMLSVARTQVAGGILSSYVTPDSYVPLEQLYRRLPPAGAFSADKPQRFLMGAFTVPENMAFFLLDYRFDIYRFSGIGAGDFVPVEDRRLSTHVGWNVSASGKQQGNWNYQLLPSAATPAGNAFASNSNAGFIPGAAPSPASQAQFELARQQAGGPDLSTMPQRRSRDGLLNVPYTWTLLAKERLQIECIVFSAIPIPIAFFEASITGLLVPRGAADRLLEVLKPPQQPPGGI